MAKFKKKPAIVEAIRITQSMAIDGHNGVYKGEPGDWLITSDTGEEYFVNNEAFITHYEPLDETAKKYIQEVEKKFKFGL